jgi:hypothetical protein
MSSEIGASAVVIEQRFEHNHPPNALAVAKKQIKVGFLYFYSVLCSMLILQFCRQTRE